MDLLISDVIIGQILPLATPSQGLFLISLDSLPYSWRKKLQWWKENPQGPLPSQVWGVGWGLKLEEDQLYLGVR